MQPCTQCWDGAGLSVRRVSCWQTLWGSGWFSRVIFVVDWWNHRTKFSIIRPKQSDMEVVSAAGQGVSDH